MSKPQLRWLLFAFALVLTFASRSSLAADLHIGVAAIDITGPKGYRMSGYFSERLNTGTHDPLFAKAIVLKQGEGDKAASAALVFCDLIGLGREVSDEARQRAAKATGINAKHILIAATHSHTGPLYGGALRQYFHDRAVAKHGKDPHEEVDYAKELTNKLVQVITEANKKAAPGQLSAGFATQQGLSFNRRFHMKDGSVVFNPGKLNPNIVKVVGPIDPQVGLMLVRNKDGEPLASLSVFALHLDTVGGTEYSADYPHYLENILREQHGDSFISMFAAGTCGDINHIDVSHNKPQKGQEEAKRIGVTLAATVTDRLTVLSRIDKPSLAVKAGVAHAPLQTFSDEQIAWANKQMDKVGTSQLPFLAQVEAYKILAVERYRKLGDSTAPANAGPTIPLEVQAFRISDDVALVGLPGEVFVELGFFIKQHSPFKTTIVMELCNDAPGYIPTKKAFSEGSYETVNSRVKSGGGEQMAELAVELLKGLKPAQ